MAMIDDVRHWLFNDRLADEYDFDEALRYYTDDYSGEDEAPVILGKKIA